MKRVLKLGITGDVLILSLVSDLRNIAIFFSLGKLFHVKSPPKSAKDVIYFDWETK